MPTQALTGLHGSLARWPAGPLARGSAGLIVHIQGHVLFVLMTGNRPSGWQHVCEREHDGDSEPAAQWAVSRCAAHA